ncbi:MAG TPA: glycosyltransferase family 2 protein [Burkholderiales bacterium]|nr:glycosyltransferase family 2 protein [Burkholderiales bacterium]
MTLGQPRGEEIWRGRGGAVLASVVRNEMLRMPHYLAYYRSLGFERFLFIDNGSTDGTRERLLHEPGAIVFDARGSFHDSGFGMAWLHPLLDRWCDGCWVLLADADELLVWPGGGSIGALTQRLERAEARALFAVMVDMYSDRPFGAIGYRPGDPFERACAYFDRGPYRIHRTRRFPFHEAYGGVRARLFRRLKVEFHPPTVSKVPLVRWSRGQRFANSAHSLGIEVPIAAMRGALLHFKLFDDIVEKCRVEVERGEHFRGAREYRALGAAIAAAPGGTFFGARISVRYEGPEQLLALGLISESAAFA